MNGISLGHIIVFRSHVLDHISQKFRMHTVLQQFHADVQRISTQPGAQELGDIMDVLAGLWVLQKTGIYLFVGASLILVVGRTANALL